MGGAVVFKFLNLEGITSPELVCVKINPFVSWNLFSFLKGKLLSSPLPNPPPPGSSIVLPVMEMQQKTQHHSCSSYISLSPTTESPSSKLIHPFIIGNVI